MYLDRFQLRLNPRPRWRILQQSYTHITEIKENLVLREGRKREGKAGKEGEKRGRGGSLCVSKVSLE